MTTNCTNQEDRCTNVEKNSVEKSTGFSRRQKLTLFSISLANVAGAMCYSILAPFFPIEATQRGASDTVVGLVFGCFALGQFVSSPIHGKFLPKIGSKVMFLSGNCIAACSSIIFGFLGKIPEDRATLFIGLCFTVRTIEAVGVAAMTTASFSIIAEKFPDNLSTTLAVVEMFIGVGMMIGPSLGGYLYKVGGYTLPFLVLGVCMLLVVMLNIFLLPEQEDGQRPQSGSIVELLLIPSVLVTSACILVGAMAITFLEATLAKHLLQFNLDSTGIGLIFFIIPAAYALSSIFWGHLTDRFDIPKLLMIIGNIGACASFLFLGPAPFFNIKSQLLIVILSLILLGVSFGCFFAPAFYDLITTTGWNGMPDNIGTYSVVSGLFTSFFALGEFIGPTVGGTLVDVFGFKWASTVMAALYLLMALIIILFSLWEYQCGKGRRRPKTLTTGSPVNSNVNEGTPLTTVSSHLENEVSTEQK